MYILNNVDDVNHLRTKIITISQILKTTKIICLSREIKRVTCQLDQPLLKSPANTTQIYEPFIIELNSEITVDYLLLKIKMQHMNPPNLYTLLIISDSLMVQ